MTETTALSHVAEVMSFASKRAQHGAKVQATVGVADSVQEVRADLFEPRAIPKRADMEARRASETASRNTSSLAKCLTNVAVGVLAWPRNSHCLQAYGFPLDRESRCVVEKFEARWIK